MTATIPSTLIVLDHRGIILLCPGQQREGGRINHKAERGAAQESCNSAGSQDSWKLEAMKQYVSWKEKSSEKSLAVASSGTGDWGSVSEPALELWPKTRSAWGIPSHTQRPFLA